MTCTGLSTCSIAPGRDDTYKQQTTDLEQLRAFPLAPHLSMAFSHAARVLVCTFCVFLSVISAATLSALIELLPVYPPGQGVSKREPVTLSMSTWRRENGS